MSDQFDSRDGLILVRVKLWGPDGDTVLTLALDTGATDTLIGIGPLVTVGYDPVLAHDRVQVTTGSSVEFVARIVLDKIQALDQVRTSFRVLCHTLPTSAGVDGLLGLDFLRGQSLSIDFREGLISLG
jgi:hypothetical protein